MSRINTNVQSLIGQRVLGMNQGGLSTALERLSTGLKINRGKDDPAGLIASENLATEMKGINAAITNADRADQVVNIAEGGLQEVSGLLSELQGLITTTASSAGLSAEEKKANQLQIDSILQTIDRISSSTSFQGTKLLNGSFDFKTSSVAAGVSDFRVNAAKFTGDSMKVDVLVTASAQQAGLYTDFGGTSIDMTSGSSFVIEVAGSLGSRQLSFSSGTALSDIAAAINTFSDVTGVEASVSGNGIRMVSSGFGSSEYVSVKVVDGEVSGSGIAQFAANDDVAAASYTTFANAKNGVRDTGQDLGATINGVAATSEGRTARINTDFLDVEINLDTDKSQALGSVNSGGAFTITGGGADFQLAGKVNIAGRVSLGIADVATRKLGSSELGYLSELASGKGKNVVNGDLEAAQKVVSEAIRQTSSLRGRLGAFQKNTIGATVRSLGVASENTAAAQSVIRDADFATETASLTRSQILVSASTNILSMANSQPQTVLQLLG
ncbi:MAG TPA: flagellin [Phycisphaerales bacterium]|nr:flagellin [Phycisphaerales bacterium]